MRKIIKYICILLLIIFNLIGCSNSEEKEAQSVAERFVKELYTVDIKDIDSFNLLSNSKTNDINVFKEEIELIHKSLKPLMTDNSYKTLLNNRTNYAFIEICAKANYAIQVINCSLSKTTNDTEENNIGYKFEVNLKFISTKDQTEQEDVGKGHVGLIKESGQWKISGYKVDVLPKVMMNTQINDVD